MRRIIYASAAAAVLASSTGCQQCWDSFRRFEAWKFNTVFGRSAAAYDQVVAMPAAVAAPICQPIDACSPSAAVAMPSPVAVGTDGCACSSGGLTTVPVLPGAIQSSTTLGSGTIVSPTPGPGVPSLPME